MKSYLTAIAMAALFCSCGGAKSDNPLLSDFDTPFQTPPFDKIKTEHYIPAFDKAIEEARAEMKTIIENPEAPTFANTIEAMEYAGHRLNVISGIFFNLNEANTDDEMQKVAMDVQPKITAYGNDIALDPKLFERVKTIYEQRDSLNLNQEQMRLLEKTYKSFSRNGAALNDADKEIYRKITEELGTLSIKFNQNLLAATNGFTLNITDSTQLEGLPESARTAAAEEAKGRKLQGWVFTLQSPSYSAFMTYSPNRELKEKLYRAYNTRAIGGANDNTEVVKRMVELRMQLANLLGYKTFADYVLEERMAENVPNVHNLLTQLLEKSLPSAKKDVETVAAYAKAHGADYELTPWDFGYWSEKYKDETFAVNDEMTKPYFKLENVEKGIFMLAEKLYGLKFVPNEKIAIYTKDVKVYEVYNETDRLMGILYMDYFPRESKRGGAWMTLFREQGIDKNGVEQRPLVSVVTNFTKPTANEPSLLTFYEVTTLLHEFGHALNGLLAEGTYSSLTGTNVYRDFVELPSQIMENWAYEKEFLDLFAEDYKTGEKIPTELVEKLVASRNFLAGYASVRQVSLGLADMAWHSITAPITGSVEDFEMAATKECQLIPHIQGTAMAPQFGHIFAGGYSAGYYGYKWAEVLEADAFSLFKEKGIFNREVAESFRSNILSKGGTEDPNVEFVNFRGHAPSIEPLLIKSGLIQKK